MNPKKRKNWYNWAPVRVDKVSFLAANKMDRWQVETQATVTGVNLEQRLLLTITTYIVQSFLICCIMSFSLYFT